MSVLTILLSLGWGALPPLANSLILSAAVVAALSALFVAGKKLWTGWKGVRAKVTNFYEAVTGTDEVLHPQTGNVLAPSTPGIAVRMHRVEKWQEDTAQAIVTIASTQERLVELTEQVVGLTRRFEEHEKDNHEWQKGHEEFTTTWIAEHNALHTMVNEVRALKAE